MIKRTKKITGYMCPATKRKAIFATAVCWVIFMFVPYGFMIWRGRKEHDNAKFYNGIAGIWAVHFLMFGLFLLTYISRNR